MIFCFLSNVNKKVHTVPIQFIPHTFINTYEKKQFLMHFFISLAFLLKIGYTMHLMQLFVSRFLSGFEKYFFATKTMEISYDFHYFSFCNLL